MQDALRVCYGNSVSGIRVNFLPGSRYSVTAKTPTKVKDVLHVLSLVPNVTDFAFESDVHGCIRRLQSNMSDVIAGDLVVANSDSQFQVPVPWKATTLYLVAGYNLTKYEEQQATRGRSLLGVLTNLGNFDQSVYSIVIVLLILLLLICLLDSLIWREKWRAVKIFHPRVRSHLNMRQLMYRRMLRNRFTVLLVSLSAFFIFTPFKCMFKTTQVIVEPPDLIEKYQDVIDRNASVDWTNLRADVPALLQPSERDTRHKNLVYLFYQYAMGHKFIREKRKANQKVLDVLKKRQALTFDQKLISIGDHVNTERLLAIGCTLTFKRQLHRYFKFHDPVQREQLTGFALRVRLKNRKLLRNLRATLEFGTVDIRETRLARYIYKDFEFNEATPEHYKKQKILCYQENLKFDKTQGIIFTSDCAFFSSIFLLVLLCFSLASIVLALEMILG